MLGALDSETDPFKAHRVPFPFAFGIYFSERDYWYTWGDDCIDKTVAHLRKMKRCILIAHNGGKFDFAFLIEDADEVTIRNGRIVQMRIGRVTLKDSWPLMPFKLEEFRKTKINYDIFERKERNKAKNKSKILAYLKDDCRDLLELYTGFRAIVGKKDTIGAASFYNMRKHGIEIERSNETHDDLFRQWFFGGRVFAFKRGVFKGKYQYFDLNSAYPYAMTFKHPHGTDYAFSKKLPKMQKLGPQFLKVDATSFRAFPIRSESGSIEFPTGRSIYLVTGWELRAALETRSCRLHKVIECWNPRNYICFAPFVHDVFARKAQAKKEKDQIHYLAYKYLGNSGYGKFAQNPRDFREYLLMPFGDCPEEEEWEWEIDYGKISLWSRPTFDGEGFYDVATAASITGFVRALLWRGICAAIDVLYCDTDAILCRHAKVKKGDAIGQWKLEGNVREARIAGKKLYGVKYADGTVKIASKGARLSWSDMLDLCRGKEVKWVNEAPTFSATLGAHFVERNIKST